MLSSVGRDMRMGNKRRKGKTPCIEKKEEKGQMKQRLGWKWKMKWCIFQATGQNSNILEYKCIIWCIKCHHSCIDLTATFWICMKQGCLTNVLREFWFYWRNYRKQLYTFLAAELLTLGPRCRYACWCEALTGQVRRSPRLLRQSQRDEYNL